MKNKMLIGINLLLVVGSGLASQVAEPTYENIRAQYDSQQPIADLPQAIEIVEKHLNGLKAQRSVYAPRALKVLGTGLGLVAGVGLIVSVGGALGAYAIFNSPENSKMGKWLSKQPVEIQQKAREYSAQEYMKYIPFNQRGLSYGEFLKHMYLGIPYEERAEITWSYLNSIRDLSKLVPIAGVAAPITFPISLAIAGLSKYLFNKAASYKNEQLEELITQDEKMLIDLRARKS